MPPSTQRIGLLRVLLPRAHRFRGARRWMALLSVLLVAAVPLLGFARIDLWRGGHRLLGEPTSFGKGLMAALLFGTACYLVTFVVNAFGGRLFCGFGCPIAQANRLREAVVAARAGEARGARLRSWSFAAAFAGAALHWWIDPALWRDGGAIARLAALGAWLGGTLLVQAHARWWSWSFCRGWCPVGLYYSVVTPRTTAFGIAFDRAAGTCVECNACDRICPVGLPPRDLLAVIERDDGLALARSPGFHHCLSCGDCIEACEHVVGRRGLAPVPLTFTGGRRRPA
jgi:polyferredoxin